MKRSERALYSAILMLIPGSKRKVNFMRKHHLFGHIGKNVHIQRSKLPLYSKLIHIHDNVTIASNVGFVTHDAIHSMLNKKFGGNTYVERLDCIEIMDNVFIGSGTRILYGTRIGSNVIVGSGSMVNKDIPDNSVYAGVPARYICSFDEYCAKARAYSENFTEKFGLTKVSGVDDALAAKVYEDFKKRKEAK